MRYSVVSYGSEGDTRPIAAVCRGLIDAGHEVLFFCERASIAVARDHGVPAAALAGDIQAALPLDDPSTDLRGRDILKASKSGLDVVNDNTHAWMLQLTEHARESDAILFSGLTALLGPVVARELRKPAIGLLLQPIVSPTRSFPAALLPPLRLPGRMNLWTYGLARAVIQRMYGKSMRSARHAVFGTALEVPIEHTGPILYGMSSHLVRRPEDWPEDHEVCGAWAFAQRDWKPTDDLARFLAAGPAPIYVGFGALSSFVRGRYLQDIAAAFAGRRVIFYPGWSQIDASMLPANFFVAGHTEHAWLFPRMSLVVHHGGAGTTHTAARAGVPSIAVPFAVDQFFWAGRLANAGVAPPYVRAGRLNAARLMHMIEFASRDSVRQRAQSLGRSMAQERGVARAVTRIERYSVQGSASASRARE